MNKTCSKCGKPGEFYMNGKYPRSECKVCIRLKRKGFWRENGDRICEQRRRHHDPKKKRRWDLNKLYGLTPERYEKMLIDQGGHCATCPRTTPGGRGNNFHVDHDHKTHEIRGLLCTRCNIALGQVKDDSEILRALVAYLERNSLTSLSDPVVSAP